MTRLLIAAAAALALGGCVVVVQVPAGAPGAAAQKLQNPCARIYCRERVDTRKWA